jgi:hypothetical protein
MQTPLNIILAIALFLALLFSLSHGLNNKEAEECKIWHARNYPKHFAQWQIDQCNHYNVQLNNN